MHCEDFKGVAYGPFLFNYIPGEGGQFISQRHEVIWFRAEQPPPLLFPTPHQIQACYFKQQMPKNPFSLLLI